MRVKLKPSREEFRSWTNNDGEMDDYFDYYIDVEFKEDDFNDINSGFSPLELVQQDMRWYYSIEALDLSDQQTLEFTINLLNEPKLSKHSRDYIIKHTSKLGNKLF